MRMKLISLLALAGLCAVAFAAVPAVTPPPGVVEQPKDPALLSPEELQAQEQQEAANYTPSSGGPLTDEGSFALDKSYLYWKNYYTSYLFRTSKEGGAATQVRSASWQSQYYTSLPNLTPDGNYIMEYQGGQYYIRKHDAVSGSYTDMYTGQYVCYPGAGSDNTYVYKFYNNYVYKFRISDGAYISSTYCYGASYTCYNQGVMNDTLWVGNGSGTYYLWPTSWMDGGSHSYARSQNVGYWSMTQMGMTYDGKYYYFASFGTTFRRYNKTFTSYTDYTTSGWGSYSYPFGVMAVNPPPLTHNVATAGIIVPSGTYMVGQSITPQGRIENIGLSTEGPFDVTMTLPGYTSTKTISSLAAGAAVTLSFDAVTLTTGGFFSSKCSTRLTGDMDATDDAFVGGYAVANFIQNFEAYNGNYLADPDLKWEWCTPQSPRPAAHSGTMVWSAPKTGTYPGSANWKLMSTSYIALVDSPVLGFWHWISTYQYYGYDGGNCQVSTDGGANWTLIYPWAGHSAPYDGQIYAMQYEYGYYGSYSGWKEAYFKLPVRSGQAFKIRWRFATYLSGYGYGWMVDDVAGIGFREPLDVAAYRLVEPVGIVDSGTLVNPRAWVRNNTGTSQTFDVKFDVGAGYTDTKTVTLAGLETTLVAFTPYTQLERGTNLAVRCSTRLTGDELTTNDKVQAVLHGRVRDVGVSTIVSPTDPVVWKLPWVPRAVYKNYGTTTESFNCYFMRDDGAYSKSKTVELEPGDDTSMVFLKDSAMVEGPHVIKAYTVFPNDMTWYNDTVRLDFDCARHDVGATEIIAPIGTIAPSVPVTATAKVVNFGGFDETFRVWFKIADADKDAEVYRDSVTVSVSAGADLTVDLPHQWIPPGSGSFTTVAYTELATEQARANDSAHNTVRVDVPFDHDVAVTAIDAPGGQVDTISTIVPKVTVKNLAVRADDFMVYATIFDPSDAVIYTDAKAVTGLASGATKSVTFASWTGKRALGAYSVRCSAYVAGDIHPADNLKVKPFAVVSKVVVGWYNMASVPPGRRGKGVKDGGALAYSSEALDAEFVYAFKGNNVTEFYKYNIAANTWAETESIPWVGPSGRKKGVKKGASLASLGGKVYALKGASVNDFFAYDPAALPGTQMWSMKASVPGAVVKDGGGLVGVTLPAGDFIYDLKGSGTTEFWRYNIAIGNWETRKAAPTGASGKGYKAGSCVATDGVYIYVLKGSYNEFYAYDIANDSWITKADLPLVGMGGRRKKAKDGAGLAVLGDAVFCLKGGNSRELWHYQGGVWWQDPDMPVMSGKNVKNGGAIVATPQWLHAMKGNGTIEFYLYGPGAALAPTAIRPQPGANAADQGVTAQSYLAIAPNPFSGASRISYSLPKAGNVSVKLYDVTGTLVRTLAEGSHEAGVHTATLDASRMARGIYVLKLESDHYSTTSKLVIE